MGGDATEDSARRRFVNVVALLAVLALVLVGYWTFHALGHSRRLQRCLDAGRSNCVDFVNPAK
jgi:flagellar biogenesis protein FliO